ncbi:hypothetical protein DPMN_120909 [Dreissena polymorpha]|uniref:Uncharacterized protein n=1 Tax=Dreissena polymorpha TaxID=45954 RepID=A0A9D4GPI3_DREPO|nr:hypothetical protein DPMN_120909 [Dreissena polymorpha]
MTAHVLKQNVIRTNVNTLSATRNAPPPGVLVKDIIWMNLLTKFHEDRTINENCSAPDGHVFQPTGTIFELIQDIIGTNLLLMLTSKNAPPPGGHFHDDRKINVASRVFTMRPCFSTKGIIFERVQDIIGMNLLTKFNEDRKINVASRVLTRKNAPPLGSHVFKATGTIFELIQDIIETNLLTKFHEDCTLNVPSRVLTRKNVPPPGGHVFQSTGFIFKLIQDNIGKNLLTEKNAPPIGSHVFQANTNLLTKFHEGWTINVGSRVLTRQMLTPHNRQKAITKAHH